VTRFIIDMYFAFISVCEIFSPHKGWLNRRVVNLILLLYAVQIPAKIHVMYFIHVVHSFICQKLHFDHFNYPVAARERYYRVSSMCYVVCSPSSNLWLFVAFSVPNYLYYFWHICLRLWLWLGLRVIVRVRLWLGLTEPRFVALQVFRHIVRCLPGRTSSTELYIVARVNHIYARVYHIYPNHNRTLTITVSIS